MTRIFGKVRRLLQWRVRLGSFHSLVCRDPVADLEQQYQALVQPLPVTLESATWSEADPAPPRLTEATFRTEDTRRWCG